MSEDRLSAAFLGVFFVAVAAVGFATEGTHPLVNSMALGLGAAFWHLAWEES